MIDMTSFQTTVNIECVLVRCPCVATVFFSFSPSSFSPRRSPPGASLFPSRVAASPLLFALGHQIGPDQARPRPATGLSPPESWLTPAPCYLSRHIPSNPHP